MRPMGKIRILVQSLAHRLRQGITKTENSLLKGYPVFTRWNIARVLALGVLLSVGASMYFNLTSEGKADTASIGHNMQASSVQGDARYLRSLNNDDEWRYGSPYVEDFSAGPRTGVGRGPELPIVPDDEWRFSPPYMEDFRVDSGAYFSANAIWVCRSGADWVIIADGTRASSYPSDISGCLPDD